MPLSGDQEARNRQLANLRRGGPSPALGNRQTVTHGANSEACVRELREKHLAELVKAFPNASGQELAIQAHRLAQLELLGAFVDERGVIRHKRRGDVFPAASFMDRLAVAFERQHALLLDRERSPAYRPTLGDFIDGTAAP